MQGKKEASYSELAPPQPLINEEKGRSALLSLILSGEFS